MCFIHERKSLDQLWPNAHLILPSFHSGLSLSLLTCRCVAVIPSHQSHCVNTTCGPTFKFFPATHAGVARWRFPVSHTLDYCMFYIPRCYCTNHNRLHTTNSHDSPMWSMPKIGTGFYPVHFCEDGTLWRHQLHGFKKERGLSLPPLFSVLWLPCGCFHMEFIPGLFNNMYLSVACLMTKLIC